MNSNNYCFPRNDENTDFDDFLLNDFDIIVESALENFEVNEESLPLPRALVSSKEEELESQVLALESELTTMKTKQEKREKDTRTVLEALLKRLRHMENQLVVHYPAAKSDIPTQACSVPGKMIPQQLSPNPQHVNQSKRARQVCQRCQNPNCRRLWNHHDACNK